MEYYIVFKLQYVKKWIIYLKKTSTEITQFKTNKNSQPVTLDTITSYHWVTTSSQWLALCLFLLLLPTYQSSSGLTTHRDTVVLLQFFGHMFGFSPCHPPCSYLSSTRFFASFFGRPTFGFTDDFGTFVVPVCLLCCPLNVDVLTIAFSHSRVF